MLWRAFVAKLLQPSHNSNPDKLYFFQTSRLDGTLGTSRLTIED